MRGKRFCAMMLAGALALGACSTSVMAAKNEKMNADEMDIPAILEETDEKGTVNV